MLPGTGEEVVNGLVQRHFISVHISDGAVEVEETDPQGQVDAGAQSQHSQPSKH